MCINLPLKTVPDKLFCVSNICCKTTVANWKRWSLRSSLDHYPYEYINEESSSLQGERSLPRPASPLTREPMMLDYVYEHQLPGRSLPPLNWCLEEVFFSSPISGSGWVRRGSCYARGVRLDRVMGGALRGCGLLLQKTNNSETLR